MESRTPKVAANKWRHVRGNLNHSALLFASDIYLRCYTTHSDISTFAIPPANFAQQAKFPFGVPRNLCYNRAAAEKSGSWRAIVETLAKRFYVSGEVQGVGFRFFVGRETARLGLAGYVKNLFDGRVEVYAIGNATQLEALKNELRRGPRMATVDHVAEAEAEVLPAYSNGFTIERDN